MTLLKGKDNNLVTPHLAKSPAVAKTVAPCPEPVRSEAFIVRPWVLTPVNALQQPPNDNPGTLGFALDSYPSALLTSLGPAGFRHFLAMPSAERACGRRRAQPLPPARP